MNKKNNMKKKIVIEEDNNINISKNELEDEFENIDCNTSNFFKGDCNKFLLKKEVVERNILADEEDTEKNVQLYPNLNDPNFNIKIASKKEFNDTKYDGTIYEKIKEQADILAKADFELQPHQAFVKNFLSFQTPYNSLLLYHGLGSGKTCSAIGICEEMRDYMKQMGITKKILIVASENVQDNFKLQLFDERKLKQVNGIWSTKGCIGNKILKEINPMNMPISKEKIISQAKNLINSYYIFLGYIQFANYIIKTMNYEEEYKPIRDEKGKKQNRIQQLKGKQVDLNKRVLARLRTEFNNRLVVIDEVHNIRKTDDNENKKVAVNLEYLVKSAQNMRLVLLSATPMYNSYKEIVWLLNLMNMNDRRGKIDVKDVFDKRGNFKKEGEELIIRKATGYVSYVRGENPYTFPYRIYPDSFAEKHTFPFIKYPEYQMNLKKIKNEDKKRILKLFLTHIGNCENCGVCQYCCYKYIIHNIRNKKFSITTKEGVVREMPSFENMESFGYTLLQTPLESLIISYPVDGLKNILNQIPADKYSKEFSPSFDETTISEKKKLEDENVGPIINTTPELIVESHSSVRKDSTEGNEDKDNENNKIKSSRIQFNPKKGLIIELSDDDKNDSTLSSKDTYSSQNNKTLGSSDASVSNKTNKTLQTSSDYLGGKKIKDDDEKSQTKKNDLFTIDPHQLTGKIGLERMMSFKDSRSPPQKGEFEYKKKTIERYGRIFSPENIEKYSAKIKNVLNNIYDEKNDKVSEGIILIYSQYIDSALIPMALALEEMGFTRFGEKGTHPLFKKRPTDVVDVRTMKSPKDKKDFMPARYSMITGDPRLSPNNDYEVKEMTNEINKEGNKVKVVLISKAGSEGIDFKFIRQVHILEPWYNMNRIEQIIGRAVRNFSHKDLPFEKRNVEIFMYGTILDDNIEESADLYTYRVAEHKAMQIGKVSRVLKESAVDCIINHDQTNFTQDIMNSKLTIPITQELSDGKILKNFKLGDAPFSPACDYMATCNYDCRPDKDIKEKHLNYDTYDENFIVMNSEKILQRIRMLFKERFFYKKDTLLQSIRIQKEYPYIQIYSALTFLIEDENEFIVDKYGRNGRLVNIGDYYLFQPIELNNENISIYERVVPIDYKHEFINFELNKDIKKKGDIYKENEAIQIDDKLKEGEKIISKLKEDFDLTHKYTNEKSIPRGDNNWFKHCGFAIKKMMAEYPDSQKYLIYFLVSHMIETLLFNDKIQVMNYLYSLSKIKKNTLEWFAKEYFEKNTIVVNKELVFIGYHLNKRMIMKLNENNIWVETTPEEQREIAMNKETKHKLTFVKNQYNQLIGFMGYDKQNKNLLFKTKDMDSKRDTGAICSQANKSVNLKKLNAIIGENKYTLENTKAQKDENNNVIQEMMGNIEICILEEFILRYFNEIEKDNKKWFLTPEMAIYFKIYTIFE